MLIHLMWRRPFKNKLLLAHLVVNEVFILTLSACVLSLAVLDSKGLEDVDHRNTLGEAIVAMNIVFSSFNLIFVVVFIVKYLLVLYKKIRAARAQGKKSCCEILKFVLTTDIDLKSRAVLPATRI